MMCGKELGFDGSEAYKTLPVLCTMCYVRSALCAVLGFWFGRIILVLVSGEVALVLQLYRRRRCCVCECVYLLNCT